MAKPIQEACQLYIEQEIDSGLEEGMTPFAIGQRISDWVAKLFEVKIRPNTIEVRAHRKKHALLTNVSKEPENQKPEEVQAVNTEEHEDKTEVHEETPFCPVCKKRKVSRRKLKSGVWNYSPKCPHCYKEARNQPRPIEIIHDQIDSTRDDPYWIAMADELNLLSEKIYGVAEFPPKISKEIYFKVISEISKFQDIFDDFVQSNKQFNGGGT